MNTWCPQPQAHPARCGCELELFAARIPGNASADEVQAFRIPRPNYNADKYQQVAHYTASAMAAEAMHQTECSRAGVVVNVGNITGPDIGQRQAFVIQQVMSGKVLAMSCSDTSLSQLIDKIKEMM